jgi:hypothetical protein
VHHLQTALRKEAAIVIQSHARYCLAALHCHERAEAAKLENLQGWRDQENARAPQDRLWRWEAALEVQRVYRGHKDRAKMPFVQKEVALVLRAEKVQRWVFIQEESDARRQLYEHGKDMIRNEVVPIQAKRKQQKTSAARIQRWWRVMLQRMAQVEVAQIQEELYLRMRSEALQRRSLVRTEDAQWHNLQYSFKASQPASLKESLQRQLEAKQRRMQAEKQSLLSSFNSSASTPEPTLGHSSEWTMSKWQFEKRASPAADERGPGAAAAPVVTLRCT